MVFNWILIVIIIILNLILGVLVLAKNPRNRINRSFFLMVMFVIAWTVVNYLENENLGISLRSLFLRLDFLLASFLIFFFLSFCLNFSQLLLKKAVKFFLLILSILFGLLSLSNYLIKNIAITDKTIIFEAGALFPLYTLFIIICFALGCYKLAASYRDSIGVKKVQLIYILVGLSSTAIILLFLNLILPQIVFVPLLIGRIGIHSLIIFILFSFYAIIRYRLMDIRFALGRTSVYLLSFLSVAGIGFALIILNNWLNQPLPYNIFFPLSIVIAVIFYQLFFKVYEKIAAKYFYYTLYSYKKVLTDLSKKLTTILDINKLTEVLATTLINTMRLDRVAVLEKEEGKHYNVLKNIGFNRENGISLVTDNFLTEYLQKRKKLLVYEELSLIQKDSQDEQEKKELGKLRSNMNRIEADVCLPLFWEKEITGIIVLGKKISKESYSKEDIELLEFLSSQSAIAFQNARFYDQVEDLSQNLQQKVNAQTKKLRTAYEELKKVDEAKTKFISMASHQLRTPLTAIKGYISMLLEGDYGELKSREKDVLDKVFQSNERLIGIVGDLLDISRMELGKMKLNKTKVNINDLVMSCYEEMKVRAKEKKLDFKLKNVKGKIPKINIDELKIRQAVLNILDNAIRYTKKGKIEISAFKKNQSVIIKVEDTGVGLIEEERKSIFENFNRGAAGINLFIEGTGLGLAIARRYLNLHKGEIWAESAGGDKGSSFYIKLPILG